MIREKFIFDLQRFATVTPTEKTITITLADALMDGSTIAINAKYGNVLGTVTGIYSNGTITNVSSNNGSFTSMSLSMDGIKIVSICQFMSTSMTITFNTSNNSYTITKNQNNAAANKMGLSSIAINGVTFPINNGNVESGQKTDYTIAIDGQTYSVEFDNSGALTKVNGTDLVDGKVKIGDKTYNFSGNSSSITYSEVAVEVWTVDNGLAKYGTDSNVLISISGLKNPSAVDGAISGLTLNETAKTVTVAKDLLGENDVAITSGEYTLQLGDGITAPQTTTAHFEDTTYKSASNTAGYALSEDKKTIAYTKASEATNLFTLTNAIITDDITVDTTNKTVILTAANLNKKNVTVDNGYTLGMSGVAAPTETKAAGFDGSAYKAATFSEGYTASGNTIFYIGASGGETLFTLTNAIITDDITVDTTNKTVILTAANLNKKNVTVDGGYTLALKDVAAPTEIKAEGFYGSAYKTATFTEGYTASDNTITYAEAIDEQQTLFTLSNAAITNAITVDITNKIVTLTAANLSKKNVTVDNDDYTLALDKDYSATETKAEGFYGSAYKTATFSEGYTASGGTITYTKPSGGSTLFTLSNATITDDIKVENNTITLTAANLNQKNVTVDNGYTLALDKDYSATQTKAAGFDGSAYKTATFSESYTASGGTITYTEQSGGQTLFTLTNATITDAITVDTAKKTVTLTEANLNKKNVTVDNGYTLALDKDYSATQTKAAGFDGSAYKTATFSESYTASGNTITYTEPSGGEILFTLSNATITDAIKVDTTKQTITLTEANLNKKNVTVDNGYTLALDKDYSSTQTKAAGFDGSAYKTATFSESYTASGGTINYTEPSGGATLFTLSNAIITDAITVDTTKQTVTLTAANLNKKNVTVDNGYTLALDKDYSATQTKAAGFDGSAYKTATFSEGYTASGDTITYTEPSGGEILFTLSNATITDAIKVDTAKKTVTLSAANLNKKNVTVDNGYTLALDKDYSSTQTKAAGFDGSAYKTATFSESYTASGGRSQAAAQLYSLSPTRLLPTLSPLILPNKRSL